MGRSSLVSTRALSRSSSGFEMNKLLLIALLGFALVALRRRGAKLRGCRDQPAECGGRACSTERGQGGGSKEERQGSEEKEEEEQKEGKERVEEEEEGQKGQEGEKRKKEPEEKAREREDKDQKKKKRKNRKKGKKG